MFLINTQFKEGLDLRVIENFLVDRSQIVKIDYVKSKALSVTSGVPKGTILEPSLFNVTVLSARIHTREKEKETHYEEDR